MKKVFLIITCCVLLISCARAGGETSSEIKRTNSNVYVVELPEYNKACAIYSGYKAGGIYCWEREAK